MATRLLTRTTATNPTAVIPPGGDYRDMTVATFAGGGTTAQLDATVLPNGERQFGTSGRLDFWGDRLTSEVTISGTVSFHVVASALAGFTGRIRARLSKITAGGSNLESLIAVGDASQDLQATSNTAYDFTATATPTTVAPEERLILRVTVVPVAGSFGTTTPTMGYGGSLTSTNTWVETTETFTVRPNTMRLHARRTNVTGIGTFFDLLEALGSTAFTTGIVNTSASGTQIQWTRTAGGTLLEWITPRVKTPFEWTLANQLLAGSAVALESSLSANCGIRYKVFRRKPDGTELVVYTKEPLGEMTASAAGYAIAGGTLAQATSFYEDDRMVLRAYIINVGGTMAGGFTCTIEYDHNVNGSGGDMFFDFNGAPLWKAEGDPAGTSRVPSGLSTGGVGN